MTKFYLPQIHGMIMWAYCLIPANIGAFTDAASGWYDARALRNIIRLVTSPPLGLLSGQVIFDVIAHD